MKTTALAFVAALALGAAAFQANADDDKQPHVREALKHLEAAKDELKQADKDKGGHREQAIAQVDAAERQVKAGIEYDDHHDNDHDHKH